MLTDIDYDQIKIDDAKYGSILFVIDGKDVWLPRSQVEVYPDDEIVVVPEWLAIEKELV